MAEKRGQGRRGGRGERGQGREGQGRGGAGKRGGREERAGTSLPVLAAGQSPEGSAEVADKVLVGWPLVAVHKDHQGLEC